MSETKHLRPADGARVRHLDGRILDPAGERVEVNAYWTRRLRAGDVVEIAAEPEAQAGAAPTESAVALTESDTAAPTESRAKSARKPTQENADGNHL